MASPTTGSGARPDAGSGASVGAILVTGGAGYIGSHAVKALCEAGRSVVVYDDLRAGHRASVRGAELIEGDTRDTARLRDVMVTRHVTSVMHFAALAAVGESMIEPADYYRNNVEGTLGVLEAMARQSVPLFIFSSTAAIFGEPERVPIDETHPTRPINPYGETKLVVERALPYYERAYGVRSVCLRYFNAAGADPAGALGEDHRPERHLIPLALRAATGGPPLQVFGSDYPTPDGTCLRDYVHVTDLAQAHVLALEALEAGRESAVYNLGNGRPHSVREVIEAVERITGRAVPHVLAPRRGGDPAVLYASSARIRAELGWNPRYDDLDTIVRTAWAWLESHPDGYGDQPS